MYLRFTDGKSEFAPLIENFQQGKRSMIPSDLTDQELDRLEALLDVSDASMWVSRMADVLWLRRRNRLHARRAIQEYLKCAEDVRQDWTYRDDYLRRAASCMSNGMGTSEARQISRGA